MATNDNVTTVTLDTSHLRRIVKAFYKRFKSNEDELRAEIKKLKGDYLAVALERDALRKRLEGSADAQR